MDQVFMLKKLSLCHKLKFSNPYTVWKLQLDVVVLRYFKLWIMLDRITYKFWNIKGLNHQVAKTQGVDNFELQAKTQFLYSINKQNKEVLFNIEQIFEFDVTLKLIRSLTEDDTPSVYFWYIYINKVVISVSLFVPEIITHEKNIILVKCFGKFVCLVKKKLFFSQNRLFWKTIVFTFLWTIKVVCPLFVYFLQHHSFEKNFIQSRKFSSFRTSQSLIKSAYTKWLMDQFQKLIKSRVLNFYLQVSQIIIYLGGSM